jgi:DnaJ-class molecular chaperone
MKDYYEILGIQKSVDKNKIKNAYRKMARIYHPDKNLDKKEWAEEKFKEVSEAYTILNDDKLRTKYDINGSDFIKKIWRMKEFVEEFCKNNKDMIEDLRACETRVELGNKFLFYSLKYFFS